MIVLAIETSCDETSVSVAQAEIFNKKNNRLTIKILSNVVSSQIKVHRRWGGVVPNLAAREHLKNLMPVISQSLDKSGKKINEVDVFAVTSGPGLVPALLIGTNAAKAFSYWQKKPLLGIHHIEGHIYSNFAKNNPKVSFPALCLVVSGGHTQLIVMKNHLKYEIIGQTLDDAVGEAFDKIAKIIGLGYPGGPIVSALAEDARRKEISLLEPQSLSLTSKFSFPRPMLNSKTLDFSFSGLKTAVLYYWKKLEEEVEKEPSAFLKKAVCKEFEDAAVEVLKKKSENAVKKFRPKTFLLAGGVAANRRLRSELEKMFREKFPKIIFLLPPTDLCGDNAAMIATAAAYRYELTKNKKIFLSNWKTLEAEPNLRLGSL